MLVILNIERFPLTNCDNIADLTPALFSGVMHVWKTTRGMCSVCSHGNATYGAIRPDILRDAAKHWNKDITDNVLSAMKPILGTKIDGKSDRQFLKLANAAYTMANQWSPEATHAVIIDGKFYCKLTNVCKHDIIKNPEDYVLLNIHVAEN